METSNRYLLPVVEFRANYRVAKGRPWSPLEWLVLRAVAAGARTVEDLVSIFQVHRRLVIEVLVTLTLEGWLAASSDRSEQFVLSPSGHHAVRKNKQPKTHVREPADKTAVIVREQLTGGLYRNRDLRSYSSWELEQMPEWARAIQLRPDDVIQDETLEPTQAARLLHLFKGEWIDSPVRLGPPSGPRWVPIAIDPDAGMMSGAESLAPELRLAVLQAAEILPRWKTTPSTSLLADRRKMQRADPDARVSAAVHISRDDLLCSEDMHVEYFRRALDEARSVVLVASAFVSERVIAEYQALFLAALKRGVRLELLGGYTSFDERSLGLLNGLAATAGADSQLHWADHGSRSHTKLLLWDRADDTVEVCIGSYNWLSANPDERTGHTGSNISIIIRSPAIVAQAARYAASLWTVAKADATPIRLWEQMSRDLAGLADPQPPPGANARARLVMDRDHDSLFRAWVLASEDRFLVASHKMGNPTASRFFPGLTRARLIPNCDVLYGELLQPEMPEVIKSVEEILAKMGAKTTHAPWLHAKLLLSDNKACISSYNFLSAGANTTKISRELGVVIDGWLPVVGPHAEPIQNAQESLSMEGLDELVDTDGEEDIADEVPSASDPNGVQALSSDETSAPSVMTEAQTAIRDEIVDPPCEPVDWIWDMMRSATGRS